MLADDEMSVAHLGSPMLDVSAGHPLNALKHF